MTTSTWFMVNYFGEIKPVQIDRFTDKSVWVRDENRMSPVRLEKRASKFGMYYPTWKQAHNLVVSRARIEVKRLRLNLAEAENKLSKVRSLGEPS